MVTNQSQDLDLDQLQISPKTETVNEVINTDNINVYNI